MSEVGSYLDLTFLNDKPRQVDTASSSGEWVAGTSVLFAQIANDIKIFAPRFVLHKQTA